MEEKLINAQYAYTMSLMKLRDGAKNGMADEEMLNLFTHTENLRKKANDMCKEEFGHEAFLVSTMTYYAQFAN